jgi:hypothetical protein
LAVYVNGDRWQTDVVQDALFKNIQRDDINPNFLIGRSYQHPGSRPDFEGLGLDEIRIYNRQISAVEVMALADGENLSEMLVLSPERRNAYLKGVLFDHYLLHVDTDYQQLLDGVNELRVEKSQLTDTLPEVMVMEERIRPRETFVLLRGEYDNYGEKVTVGTPRSLLEFTDDLPQNRLGLAQWLVSPQNPLTARVTVNRYWQMLFGQGLVDTPADFGNQGSLPSHPALLDWLAVEFVESDWDVKSLLKQMVLSATYRQASDLTPERLEQDPENRMLARGPRFRLTAEMIRDNALRVSGLLVEKIGGQGVNPYQPEGYSLQSRQFGELIQAQGDDLYRRSIYTVFRRNSPPPSMMTFDHPARDVHAAQRISTSTPLQALVTWNDTQFVEASRVLAERMMEEAGDSIQEQVTFAFRAATARAPSEEELERLVDSYNEQLIFYTEHGDEAEELVNVGDHAANKDLPTKELAARTIVASSIMNLYETLMKE